MPFAVKPKQTVLFVGDSITDCGRTGEAAPLGDGYVSLISELVTAKYPAHDLRFINEGIGGNTAQNLAHRWTDDVMRHKPDWLSIMVGINDVHLWLAQPAESTMSISPERFSQLYNHILGRTRKETKAKIVLVDPFYISTERDTIPLRTQVLKHLPHYNKVVAAMSRTYQTQLVKTHDVFSGLLEHYPAGRFCPEPVHPYRSGHLAIAYEWLKVMGW